MFNGKQMRQIVVALLEIVAELRILNKTLAGQGNPTPPGPLKTLAVHIGTPVEK